MELQLEKAGRPGAEYMRQQLRYKKLYILLSEDIRNLPINFPIQISTGSELRFL